MSSNDPEALREALTLTRPMVPRTIAFDIPTFDRLKAFQRWLEGYLKASIGNAEVVKYLLLTHPEVVVVMAMAASHGR